MTPPFSVWGDRVYRGFNPRWSYDPDSGEGAKRHGGRFNRPSVPCLYTSASPETAWLEAQQAFVFKAQPLTLCAFDVHCANVLDLCDHAVRKTLDVTLEEMACAWEDLIGVGREPPSWKIADRLIAAGAAAIVTPSFASHAGENDINVVFWQWGRRKPHQLRVIDDYSRLPKDDRSWR
ncbi:MAG: RES family NAD+ phosphorylase [Pseudomonadales bacterium]